MNDHFSLLKARYCRAVIRTAAISSGVDANRLIQAAATERPTADTLEIVERAEQAALEAIRILAIQATDRSLSSGSVEWQRAKKAVERWLEIATTVSDQPQTNWQGGFQQ